MRIILDVIEDTKIDIDTRIKIEIVLGDHISSYKDSLAIDNIVEVYFTEDLISKVNEVRAKYGYDPSVLIGKNGAMAYYLTTYDGHILVYNTVVLEGLLQYLTTGERGKFESQGLNILLHELLHIHDQNMRKKMKIFNVDENLSYLIDALEVWSEYYAHRKSAESYKVHENEVYYTILDDYINILKQEHDPYLLVNIARQIGNINSTDRIDNMTDTVVYKMEKVLNKLYDTFDKWDSLDDLKELREICESCHLDR